MLGRRISFVLLLPPVFVVTTVLFAAGAVVAGPLLAVAWIARGSDSDRAYRWFMRTGAIWLACRMQDWLVGLLSP